VRVISGATSGGAALVVKPEIINVADLKGKKIATPQLGNTQDIALRSYLKEQGMETTPEGGGDVSIVPQENSQTVDTFATGAIDGAWVPEPYLSRLVNEGGKVLVDERTLWPEGKFVTTNLLVAHRVPRAAPRRRQGAARGPGRRERVRQRRPGERAKVVGEAIGKLTGKPLDPELIAQAWRP
jgi:NitT/TauT family transport system substrate-binding protein